jgi:hypothetical protein
VTITVDAFPPKAFHDDQFSPRDFKREIETWLREKFRKG